MDKDLQSSLKRFMDSHNISKDDRDSFIEKLDKHLIESDFTVTLEKYDELHYLSDVEMSQVLEFFFDKWREPIIYLGKTVEDEEKEEILLKAAAKNSSYELEKMFNL